MPGHEYLFQQIFLQVRVEGSGISAMIAMKFSEQKRALARAVKAAHAAGKLMRENLSAAKKVNAHSRHDIKLELDVRCQEVIERTLRTSFPKVALLGEEGVSSDPKA